MFNAFNTMASISLPTPGCASLGGRGAFRTSRWAIATGESPVNGGVPVSNSYSMQPVAYTSERASTDSPRACSGERYTAEVAVMTAWPSQTARAMPKSITFTAPARFSMMFAGVTSRCTIRCRCEKSSAAHTSATICIARRGGGGPSRLSTFRRVSPSTYSTTM